jgi:IS5 family transposase
MLSAPANRHDSPLLAPTLDLLTDLGPLPANITVHLDRGYDSAKTRTELATRGLRAEIACKGAPAPIQAGQRWVVERTNALHNTHRKLMICTERRARVIHFWISLANAIIIVHRLIRRSWATYRWDTRPPRRA